MLRKRKNKFIFFYTIIFSLFYTNANCQSVEIIFKYADSLFAAHEIIAAEQEYLRVIFFHAENSLAHERLADIYYAQNNFSKAIEYYNNAIATENITENNKIDIKFKIVNSYLKKADFYFALTTLYSLPDSLNTENQQRKHFYLGICHYKMGNYLNAHKYFSLVISDSTSAEQQNLDKIIEHTIDESNKNLNIYFAASMLLPGLGQLMSLEYRKSANALFLNTFLIYVCYYTLKNFGKIDMLISVLPFFQRYYLGNALAAYNIAKSKQTQKIDEYLQQILNLI